MKTLHDISDIVRHRIWLRKAVILVWYVVGLWLTYYAALLLRFDGAIPIRYLEIFRDTLPLLFIVNVLVFAAFRLYQGIWTYFSKCGPLR